MRLAMNQAGNPAALHSRPVSVTVKYRPRLCDVFVDIFKALREYTGPAETYHAMKADALRTSYGGRCIPRKRTRRCTVDASRWSADGRKLVHVG